VNTSERVFGFWRERVSGFGPRTKNVRHAFATTTKVVCRCVCVVSVCVCVCGWERVVISVHILVSFGKLSTPCSLLGTPLL
jgi:hypothetical protein